MSEKMVTFVKIWISMADEFHKSIDRVSAKARIILERYNVMKRQRQIDLERIEELETALRKLTAENQQLQTQVEFLRIATTIAPDRADVERTRTMLSELVREIDKCITELND